MSCNCCSNAVCLNKPPPWGQKTDGFSPSCAPFDGVSTYRCAFTGCWGPRSKSLKPTTYFDPSCAPLDGISTYRASYIPLPVMPPERAIKTVKQDFDPSCAPFDGISTYRSDFVGCMGERSQSLKPRTFFDPSCAPMDSCTTHRCSFIPYCLRDCCYAKQASAKPPIPDPGMSCAPFDGVSTYRCDFFPRCVERTQNLRPNAAPRFSDAPFCDLSTYRNDFCPFHFVNCDGDTMKTMGNSNFCHDPCPPPEACG